MRRIRLFLQIACRIYSTGRFRLFPYRYQELLQFGAVHPDYEGDKTPEDFWWVSPKEAWGISAITK